jgi:hypothetical protein
VDPAHPSKTLQARAFSLNLDALTSPITGAMVMAAKVAKAPIPDPAVIGHPTSVIG